ncbi:MAG: hypothetical protein LBR37_01325 [Erysipelotrichaceae bacterium]|jgi:superfamily I DNA/RNA helicase|nr:hypothetical protein [Erysipelotrichaceae bacterium]
MIAKNRNNYEEFISLYNIIPERTLEYYIDLYKRIKVVFYRSGEYWRYETDCDTGEVKDFFHNLKTEAVKYQVYHPLILEVIKYILSHEVNKLYDEEIDGSDWVETYSEDYPEPVESIAEGISDILKVISKSMNKNIKELFDEIFRKAEDSYSEELYRAITYYIGELIE